jgi:hypothetical protein
VLIKDLGWGISLKKYHRWAASRRRERRMARIEGREPEEEKELEIPPLMVSFPKAAYVMHPDKGSESLIQELSTMSINTLEEDKVKGGGIKTVTGREDEALPQLIVHTLEEVSTKTFVQKLAEGEKFQNWVTQEAPVVFKM